MSSFRFALVAAGAFSMLAVGTAGAQSYRYRGPDYEPGVQYAPGPYDPRGPYVRAETPYRQGPSAQQRENYENNNSGTLGREGLGADPHHPEGPGNQSLGGFR